MPAKGTASHWDSKTYSDADIAFIERKHYDEGMTLEEIGKRYFSGKSAHAMKTQLRERGTRIKERTYKLPRVDTWDFRGMDVA